MKTDSHGGNIYKKAKELGLDQSRLMDYSANISPLGLPDHIREAMISSMDGIINYPDPECMALREAIARADGVKEWQITCGNGGADLLYRLAFGLRPGRVLLPAPAFVEYEEAMTVGGAAMDYYLMQDDFMIREDLIPMIGEDTDLVIICNPNNPTGLLTPRDLIVKILERAREMHCRVLVDECFLEICREEDRCSLKPYVDRYENLIILKSFTKLYAVPGVRLGYIICSDPEVIERANRAGQAWSVSTIAQAAGLAALAHPEYKDAVIKEVEKELKYMKEALAALPLKLYDGQANYLFFRAPGVTDLDRRLEEYGIMIRNCSNYVNLGEDYWRVAVKTRQENEHFLEVLKKILTSPDLSCRQGSAPE